VRDLGEVAASEAVDVLVNDIARTGVKRVASRAIHGACMAAAPAWQALLALARDSSVVSDVRRNAKHWIAVEAADQILEQTPALDAEAEVRRHVVFALSRRKDERSRTALWQMAESGDDPAVRAAAVFWLGQSEDPRALQLLESVLR
jgi:HEAT repeat protein